MISESERSISDLKSKIDAIYSITNRIDLEGNQPIQGQINSRFLSRAVYELSNIDFNSLTNQLKNSGNLKKMSFIPGPTSNANILNKLSDLLYVKDAPWPSYTEFKRYCERTKTPARYLASDARMREVTGIDDDSAMVFQSEATEEEKQDIEALSDRVKKHNDVIGSLLSELTSRGAPAQNRAGEEDRIAARTKVVNVDKNLAEAYKRMYPGVKVEGPVAAAAAAPPPHPPPVVAGKRGADGSESGGAPSKKQKRNK